MRFAFLVLMLLALGCQGSKVPSGKCCEPDCRCCGHCACSPYQQEKMTCDCADCKCCKSCLGK